MTDDDLPEGVGKTGDGPGGTPAKTEQDIIKKLLYDEGDFLTRLEGTIQRAMRFLRLEQQGGRIVLTDDTKRLRVRDQVRVLLAGRYFAWKLGLVASDKMNYREIALALNRPPYGISPELTALVRDGDVVRDADGLVSMPFHRIDGTLRELEQSKGLAVEVEAQGEPVRRNGSRRLARQRTDPVVQSMLEKPVDLSEYSWVPQLKKALDKGLAALLIAKEKYGVTELTCPQMAAFLPRKFPVEVTRAAINMAFLDVKSQYVAPASRGKEVAYMLLALGEQHIRDVASQLETRGENGGADADVQ